jgi:hypothetical protein
MNNLLFWVVIGTLGFLLYISPGFLIHRMYESFAETTTPKADAAPAQSVDTAAAKIVNLQASNAPQQASPTHNAIQNLLEVLGTPSPTTSPTAPTPSSGSNSGNSQPVEHDSTRSQPESTRVLPGPSEALKHGNLYNTTLPSNPQPGVQGMLGSMGTQARVPAERIVYVDRIRDEWEDEREPRRAGGNNPNCPDLREYIRKDSIPCWGCKLR